MNSDFRVFNYLKHREQGLYFKHRRIQLSVQQNLITKNQYKTETIRDDYPLPTFNTKAFLMVMSIDKSCFAVATSENSVGIYCSISGELLHKLIGSQYPIYTISWHPYFKNIIACSNLSGSVFVWDIFQCNGKECNFQKVWSWPSCSSITYAIGFHPFKSIMTLARDREIRFIDWEKGLHIAQWRFYSEFSWVPWVSWSFVGSSIIACIGNPQNGNVLNSIIDSIHLDQKSLSPIQCGCPHYDNNHLCEICDTCEKMSTLDNGPPKFEEYRVNAVDLIRYVLSRPEEWFVEIYVCIDCRLRFKLWADSIQIHNKYDLESGKQKSQLPHDVESACVTVIETPIAPEVVWDLFQKSDTRTIISDRRLEKFLLPKSDPILFAESQSLLRCVAMFERECLRQSICWCCLQQIHNWVLQQEDFPLFLYQSMVQVRQMVIERVQDYDNNMFKIDSKDQHKKTEKESVFGNKDDNAEPVMESHTKEKSSIDDQMHRYQSDLYQNNTSVQDQCINSNRARSHVESIELPFHLPDFYPSRQADNGNNIKTVLDDLKRLTHLHSTLKFLQFYVSEPSRLGDLINIFMVNNLRQSGMMLGPSINHSKVDSYSVRKWHLQPLGTTPQKISPRHNFTESHLVVPCLMLSGTNLTESSIRISKCGRTIAVLVPQDTFMRLHSEEIMKNNLISRKRDYSQAFSNYSILHDSPPTSNNPVVAIYASEPESSCGQLLYYFEMPYNAISLDFSPLGDHLIVGLPGSLNQSYLFWINSEYAPKSNYSYTIAPPSDNHCNIGLILNINVAEGGKNVERNSKPVKGPKQMQLLQIINHDKRVIQKGLNDLIGWTGPINCVIWNTAGGLLYSKEPGTLFSLSYIGCKG